MQVYEVFAGLGGGFGGAYSRGFYECIDYDNAMNWAWESACDEYETYAGTHGIRDIDEIMAEDDVDEDEAYEIYCDERESWLDYYVELIETEE